ncbi:MAG: GNAT family N-acetyltransferase [Spirochaetota bacterium]|nr:GNAT family N-acetyltransferase [Spirochaetota bacterium]
MKAQFEIRPLEKEDEDFLFEMLYQAIYVPDGVQKPDRSILKDPSISIYAESWGKAGDMGFLAIDSQSLKKTGAAWVRILDGEPRGYGNIGPGIPELGIAVDYPYRRQGVGRLLMESLLSQTMTGHETLSLSVQPENPATLFYEELGFMRCGYSGSSVLMRYDRE